MAVTTVSSLTESFTSGVPVLLGDEVAMVKGKGKEDEAHMEVAENIKEGGSTLAKDIETSNGAETDADEEDEFGVLQVHD